MNYLNIGLVLLIPSTLIGLYFLGSTGGSLRLFYIAWIPGVVWLIGLAFIIKGVSDNNAEKLKEKKRKAQNRMRYEENETKKELQREINQEKEIKELKEKVEALEKDK